MRSELDGVLLARFRALGWVPVRPALGVGRKSEDGRVAGVYSPKLTVRAPITIDASGAAGFLRRALAISLLRCSPRLIAYYGYRRGVVSAIPHLTGEATGWSWVAQVAPDLVSWVRL